MQINLFHQPKGNTHLLDRIANRVANRLIHYFELTLSKLHFDENRRLISSYPLQQVQSSEAQLDSAMQLHCIYQTHDIESVYGENNAN